MRLNKNLLQRVNSTMSQYPFTVEQMQTLCVELSPLLVESTLTDCCASDQSRPIFVLEKNEERSHLFLCLQRPFLRFHLIQLFRSEFDKALVSHPLKKHLLSATLKAIRLINEDRILCIDFDVLGKKRSLIAEFFPKHPNIHLIDEKGAFLWSLHQLEQEYYTAPPIIPFNPQLKNVLSCLEVESLYAELEKKFLFEHAFAEVRSLLHKRDSAIHKKLKAVKAELKRCQEWENVRHQGELLKANFHLLKRGMTQVKVWDWIQEIEITIPLNSERLPHEQVSALFRQSKKMQQGISHLELQLEKIQDEAIKMESAAEAFSKVDSLAQLELFRKKWTPSPTPKKSVKKAVRIPYHEYYSVNGCRIWVGKNAKDNETLTFKLARGSDWWLHAHNVPGSHVVIRTVKGEEPDPETLSDAIQLALYHSKEKPGGSAEVLITQQKFVTRFGKGHVGKVQISKHKIVLAGFDPARYRAIKERCRLNHH